MPVRVQLSRAKGWRKPDGAVTVARPSRWGNIYQARNLTLEIHGFVRGSMVGFYNPADPRSVDMNLKHEVTPAMLVALYRDDLLGSLEDFHEDYDELRAALEGLRGHDLCCWCVLGQPCHADVLLELANR